MAASLSRSRSGARFHESLCPVTASDRARFVTRGGGGPCAHGGGRWRRRGAVEHIGAAGQPAREEFCHATRRLRHGGLRRGVELGHSLRHGVSRVADRVDRRTRGREAGGVGRRGGIGDRREGRRQREILGECPTKLTRGRLDPHPGARVATLGDLHMFQDGDAFAGLECNLRDVSQIVELRPDAGDGTVGHHHAAGATATGNTIVAS